MLDEKLALLRCHGRAIARYERLLKTQLTPVERQYIERRLAEERSAMSDVSASTFPIRFNLPRDRAGQTVAVSRWDDVHA